jgi:UbiD family decarboxylase
MAGALRESPYPIATAPLTGFDVPWGSEVILEGVIEGRKREIEGPFGEFTGHYSGGRNMTVCVSTKFLTAPNRFSNPFTSACRGPRLTI